MIDKDDPLARVTAWLACERHGYPHLRKLGEGNAVRRMTGYGEVPNAGHNKRGSQGIRLLALSEAAMQALADGNVAEASAAAGTPLGSYIASEDCRWLWRIRISQIRNNRHDASWVARAVIDSATGTVVGHGGFHGPPDDRGMVECAYTIDPAFRRRGYARQTLAEILRWASGEPDVRVVRATIAPHNEASLRTIARFDFEQVGEQWDEEDGLELVFERPVETEPGHRED